MNLTCRPTVIGGRHALMVSGEIDLASIPGLRNAVVRLVGEAPGETVAIDLDGVTVLDDAGLGVLLGAAGRAREHDGDLFIVCTTPRLLESFARSGLSRAIEVHDRVTP